MKHAILLAALISFSAIIFTPNQATASPPDEKRVQIAWEKVRIILKACLLSDECGFTKEESEFTKRIVANGHHYSEKSLKFIDENIQPAEFSSTDGDPHRLMLTGLDPASPILINTIRISEIPMESLIGLFAHELIHHLGILDDTNRIPDQFGARITALVRRNLIPVSFGLRDTNAFFLNYPQPIQPEFPTAFLEGLFPSIVIQQNEQIIVQELWMLRRELSQICAPGEDLWSSTALPTGVNRGPTSLSVSFRIVSRCFNSAQPALRESITYGITRIDFDSSDGDFVTNGTVSFSKAPVDPNATAYLDVDITAFPPNANVGDRIAIEAEVRSPEPLKVTGCAALIGSASWTDEASEYPLTDQVSDCTILKSISDRQFQVLVHFEIPSGAPDGLQLSVSAFGLKLDSGGYLRGHPTRSTVIKIRNAAGAGAAVRTVKRSVSGATRIDPLKHKDSYYVFRGEKFNFDISLLGVRSASLVSGYIAYQAQTTDRRIMIGNLSIEKHTMSCQAGANLNCSIQIDLQNLNPSNEMVGWLPLKIVLLTSDYQFASVNVSTDETVVMVVEPQERNP